MQQSQTHILHRSEEDLDEAFVVHCFQQRLGADAVSVRELVKFPRGVSRETWIVECGIRRGGEEKAETFVIRRDLPGGSICLGDLRSEYEIYKRLNNANVPVAETLWYEDDPQMLDGQRPFFVRRHVDGDWDVPHVLDTDPQYNGLRLEIGREHVRQLAAVHTCDWQALGLGDLLEVPASPADSATCRVRAITDEIAKLQVRPLPLVTEAADWFAQHQPPHSGQVCLIKGTNGYGEEVFRDGKIVAMSDWELCCLGDPAMDFAMCQNFLADIHQDGELIWGMQPALDYYYSLTGIRVAPEAVDFYQRLYGLYRVQYSQAAARQLRDSAPLCRLAWVGIEVLHLGQVALASTIGCVNEQLPDMGQR